MRTTRHRAGRLDVVGLETPEYWPHYLAGTMETSLQVYERATMHQLSMDAAQETSTQQWHGSKDTTQAKRLGVATRHG
jgi:hypothetical protein